MACGVLLAALTDSWFGIGKALSL